MPSDPPIGRIGYVLQGNGDGKTQDGRQEFFCQGCRTWHPKKLYTCPDCGWQRPGFNKRLRSAQLDNHLLGYAHTAGQQPQFAPVTSDINLPH